MGGRQLKSSVENGSVSMYSKHLISVYCVPHLIPHLIASLNSSRKFLKYYYQINFIEEETLTKRGCEGDQAAKVGGAKSGYRAKAEIPTLCPFTRRLTLPSRAEKRSVWE